MTNERAQSDACISSAERGGIRRSQYVVNFLYNELEDFRITATIKNKRLPDAIQQMIGFYPVRMTVKPDDHEIYVESVMRASTSLFLTISMALAYP